MRNLSGKMKDRLVQKFVELDHAKTDRLLELHFKYMDKMDEADEDIAKTARMLANEGQAMDEEMIYIQKMELGLFTLQQVRTKPNPTPFSTLVTPSSDRIFLSSNTVI